MKIFKNLFGNGSKINASEIAYKEKSTSQPKQLDDVLAFGVANDMAKYGGSTLDPNTTDTFLILTSHKNAPLSSGFSFIITLFYSDKTTGNRTQIGVGYGNTKLFIRNYTDGVWGSWVEK